MTLVRVSLACDVGLQAHPSIADREYKTPISSLEPLLPSNITIHATSHTPLHHIQLQTHPHSHSQGSDTKKAPHIQTHTPTNMPVLDGGPDEETSDIMKTVDRLVAANVGVHIELPMLVVVGNQSSGKSSVLEAISKLPFPKDAGLCTRFATHIIFRRHPVTTTKVQINPAPTAGRNHRRACKAWKAEWNGSDPVTFTRIIFEASCPLHTAI